MVSGSAVLGTSASKYRRTYHSFRSCGFRSVQWRWSKAMRTRLWFVRKVLGPPGGWRRPIKDAGRCKPRTGSTTSVQDPVSQSVRLKFPRLKSFQRIRRSAQTEMSPKLAPTLLTAQRHKGQSSTNHLTLLECCPTNVGTTMSHVSTDLFNAPN